jgi:hypothetical protein
MGDPYRGAERLTCPACAAILRDFNGRLCCDACSGILLPLTDLVAAIEEHSGVEPIVHFVNDKPAERVCPRCSHVMTACRLHVVVAEHATDVKPNIDRCDAHGVWFDPEELSKVFEALRRATEPRGNATADYVDWFIEAPSGVNGPGLLHFLRATFRRYRARTKATPK